MSKEKYFDPAKQLRLLRAAKKETLAFAFGEGKTGDQFVVDKEKDGKNLFRLLKQEKDDIGGGTWGTITLDGTSATLDAEKKFSGLKKKFREMAKERGLPIREVTVRVNGVEDTGDDQPAPAADAGDAGLSLYEQQIKRALRGEKDPELEKLRKEGFGGGKPQPSPEESLRGITDMLADPAYDNEVGTLLKDVLKTRRKLEQAKPGAKGPAGAAPVDPREGLPDIQRIAEPLNPVSGKVPVAVGDKKTVRLNHAIKIDRSFKYFTLKKVEVYGDFSLAEDIKGEVEIQAGFFGSLTPFGKETASTTTYKAEAATKLTEMTSIGKDAHIKAKGGLEVGSSRSEKGDAKSSGMKIEISVTAEFAWNKWLSHELKLVLLGVDTGKEKAEDRIKIGVVKVSPMVVTLVKKELPFLTDKQGKPMVASGKLTVTFEVQPNWLALATEVGGNIGAVGMAFIGGAVMVADTYYESIKDIEDMKETAKAAERAVMDFCGGYLARCGIEGTGKSGSPLYKRGALMADSELTQRAARAATYAKRKYPQVELEPKEIEAAMILRLRAKPEELRGKVFAAFTRWVKAEFFRGWVSRNEGRATTAKNAKYVRTALGLPDTGSLPETPDFGVFD